MEQDSQELKGQFNKQHIFLGEMPADGYKGPQKPTFVAAKTRSLANFLTR